jgi:hypothetical protein
VKKTRYEIKDVSGNLVAVHVRLDLPGGKKIMWWESPDGRKGLNGVKVESLPLYGIDQFVRSGICATILVEGEKCRDSLSPRCPIPVLATVCGSGSTPSSKSLAPLAGCSVFLWPDNDVPGIQHMRRIGARLLRIDPKTNLFWVNWPDAPPGGDAADFVGDVKKLLKQSIPWGLNLSQKLAAESILQETMRKLKQARTQSQVTVIMERMIQKWRRWSEHGRPGISPDEALSDHLGSRVPPVPREGKSL